MCHLCQGRQQGGSPQKMFTLIKDDLLHINQPRHKHQGELIPGGMEETEQVTWAGFYNLESTAQLR